MTREQIDQAKKKYLEEERYLILFGILTGFGLALIPLIFISRHYHFKHLESKLLSK